MNEENRPPRDPRVQEYVDVWSRSLSSALGRIAGAPLAADELLPESAEQKVQQIAEKGLWVRFTASGHLAGEHSFLVSKEDALRLGQLMMAEPLNQNVAFGDEHREAVAELFRQVAASAALALQTRLGSEVGFALADTERSKGTPGERAAIRCVGTTVPPLDVIFEISTELAAALRSAKPAVSGSEEAPGAEGPTGSAISRDPKLELLMDVELDVTLRFGRQQMLLRDILELSPGAVVELDRQIGDPVELLVGGKVVARGEAVVVNGNYGLRVTEILSPTERIETLRQ